MHSQRGQRCRLNLQKHIYLSRSRYLEQLDRNTSAVQ